MGGIAAVALFLVPMLTGCGGSTASGFAERVNDEYCPEFVKLVESADTLQDPSDLQAAAVATREYARTGERLADELSELEPPGHVTTEWNGFVRELRTSAQMQGAVIEALEQEDLEQLQGLRPEVSRAQSDYLEALRELEDAGITLECPVPE